ncbi:hypothetical protein ACPF7Z_10260 [Halomonas sp. GXIMD04776]|uniref:hypothetical protein n=1 Tax=Halomonas sp. GXIMD04776 TaxID=3415605 RepID=UPI003CB7CE50
MTESSNNRSNNAAWQAARQWQNRARQARPSSQASGLKLAITWLLFGVMMIVGTLLGLFFLLVGWLMLPLVRHRMKKRLEQMRANQAQDVGSGHAQPRHSRQGSRHVLEGDYQVKQ